ncbi:MAG TPA: type II toxin-antitoxin system VapC family toxin [Chthonomonadaceae bacterium]|nr:type II toxin-antitoxin system VapC family toxin [Chthonomonadaceae bacterium]
MPQLLWDASALAKRYYKESGSDTVLALFAAVPTVPMITTYMNYAETAAILKRGLNPSFLTLLEFNTARVSLEDEVLTSADFALLSVDDADVLAGIALTDAHNLNSTDAAILAAYLLYALSLAPSEPPCVLVASDLHMRRAAVAEGLRTLNPEQLNVADVPAFLST